MNPILIAVGKFVRDLMGYDEQLIRRGRVNFEREQFETAYIVIDQLGNFTRVGGMENYNWTTEQLQIGAMWKGIITLDFFGNGAHNRAIEFSLKAKSQKAANLKNELGINIYNAKGFTDVKALTGQQYGERVQIEMTVETSRDITIEALRIAVPQTEFLNEV